MPIDAPWSRDAKIIEFDAHDSLLKSCREQVDRQRYLAVVRSLQSAAKLAGKHPQLAGCIAVSALPRRVRANNADVLILNGRAALSLFSWRNVRHAQWIVVPLAMRPATVIATIVGLIWRALRLCDWPIVVGATDRWPRRLLVWRVRRRKKNSGARRYLPHRLGVTGFFSQLRDRGKRHAALRWFEDLPQVAPSEDLDLLIDDVDLEAVDDLLQSGPGIQPIDVYTVTGLPSSDFGSLPYYPPYLAEQLLSEARVHRDLCRVPSPKHHFLSLAYHALYHKGFRAGLPPREGEAPKCPALEHEYAAVLRRLSGDAGYAGPIAMDALDRFLADEGWRPSHDMLVRLARRNPWIRSLLAAAESEPTNDGLAVFLLREVAQARGGIERVAELLQRHGFQVIHIVSFSPAESSAAAQAIRGGNWGRGPWPLSGGPPVAAIVAYDMEPIPPTRRQKKKFPFVANARILCKEAIRDEFNRSAAWSERCNVIHSSDNACEALEYLNVVCPQDVDAVSAKIDALRNSYATSETVVATWTKSGRRAKIEVVEYQGQLVVKKTFKPHTLRFLAREVELLQSLKRTTPNVPPLLATGDSWLMIPLYDDVLKYRRSSGKLLPLAVAKEAIAALHDIYEGGYALIDASVDNLLVDRREGLKLIDFEFSHRYDQRPVTFEESFDMAGCPVDFTGETPIQGCNSYERNWRPYIGLSLDSLQSDPEWLQQIKRAVYYWLHAYRYLPRRLRHAVLQLAAWRHRQPELREIAHLSPPTDAPAANQAGLSRDAA